MRWCSVHVQWKQSVPRHDTRRDSVSQRILIVEDDGRIADVIVKNLEAAGYECHVSSDGGHALADFARISPELLVLDLGLPGLDGLQITRRIRADHDVPILMLTARSSESDKLLGLEIGADDYITKPFSTAELMARVRALLRRSSGAVSERVIEVGALRIDPARRGVERDGAEVPLTTLEFDLIHFLASRPGRVFTREALMERGVGQRPHRRRPLDRQPREPAAAQARGGSGAPALRPDGVGRRLSVRGGGPVSERPRRAGRSLMWPIAGLIVLVALSAAEPVPDRDRGAAPARTARGARARRDRARRRPARGRGTSRRPRQCRDPADPRPRAPRERLRAALVVRLRDGRMIWDRPEFGSIARPAEPHATRPRTAPPREGPDDRRRTIETFASRALTFGGASFGDGMVVRMRGGRGPRFPGTETLLRSLPVALLAALLTAFLMVRWLTRRLQRLERLAERVEAGDLSARVEDPAATRSAASATGSTR